MTPASWIGSAAPSQRHAASPGARPGRPRAVQVVLLATAVVLTACGPAGEDVTAPTGEPVRAIVLPYLTLVPFHIAAEEGYFEEQGLDVEFVRLTGTLEAISAVATGEMDVVAGMLTVNVLNAMASGARLRLVQSMNRLDPDHCTSNAFVVRRELLESGALDDPEALRRLRWDADLLLPYGYWIDVLLEPYDLTVDDLDITSLPEPAAVEAVTNGSMDITIVSEPFLSLARASDDTAVWRASKEVVPNYEMSVMMYGPRLLDERPDLGERFATAMLRAIRQWSEGATPRNLEIAEAASRLTREQLESACLPATSHTARIDATTLMDYQRWTVERGLVPATIPEEELVEHRFIDAANAALEP